MIVVKENFLEENEFKFVQENLLQRAMPWFWGDDTDEVGDGKYQLTHIWFDNFHWDSDSRMLAPLLQTINPVALVRIKANLNPPQVENTTNGWHVDNFVEGSRTGIFYLNDNNGGTEFATGEIIQCRANTYVEFPSTIKHRGINPTDNRKVLLNINFFERKQ